MVIDSKYKKYEEIVKARSVKLSSDKKFIEHFLLGHEFLMEQIRGGKPVYGVTTGYGSSGKNYLTYDDAQTLQKNLYRFHGCGVGENLSYDTARYAVFIRLVSLSKGHSGISFELLKRLEMLLEKDMIPIIPSQGSVGASGDLTPLSYIAAVIAGEREVYYKGEERTSKEVHNELGIEPYVFKPKEALALMNGTAIMSAIAITSLKKFEILLDSMESFVAGMYEVLLSDDTPLSEFVHDESKPFSGQIEVAKNIRKKIQGSSLTHGRDDRYDKFFNDNELNIQDTYSIRCAPQVLGVVRDNLEISKNWVEQEINSVNDNPLIDGKNKKLYTSGNFYGGYIAHAMDTLKISMANVADLLDKEFALLVDDKFNRGIGENLKIATQNYYHGFKAMQITLSSLSADIIKNTTAASIHSRPTESLNQDKVSMGTTAALDFKKMNKVLEDMLSIAFIGLAQAIDIRGAEKVSPALLQCFETLRQEVSPLIEDRRMDVDIKKVKKMLNKGLFA
ncbi:HAL/PAL/TAL family ammonia-lyase [Sulfurospirillum arcachonense]|uniref:HAL/PAL/TAL family ammonia-lyase n=1 Tax=Sulfurospirillum arcachonense TaxID=57666 RepID=UPI00046B05F6|nr:aromatic amino acid ammonia-lyase [Sulfurospirillum arcachonense]